MPSTASLPFFSLASLVSVSLLATGCGGNAASPPVSPPGPAAAVAVSDAGAPPANESERILAACKAAPGEGDSYGSVKELTKHLARRWAMCTGPGKLVGLSVDAQGHWQNLKYVEGTGWQAAGTEDPNAGTMIVAANIAGRYTEIALDDGKTMADWFIVSLSPGRPGMFVGFEDKPLRMVTLSYGAERRWVPIDAPGESTPPK